MASAACASPSARWSASSPQDAPATRFFATMSLAKRLNADHVPGPGGASWNPSTIHGNPARGTGVLNNELYIGRLVWNRLRYVKDPDTGKRVSRPNPPSQWVTTSVPELRIVDDELWSEVKARQAAMRRVTSEGDPSRFNRGRRPKFLFSGLTKMRRVRWRVRHLLARPPGLLRCSGTRDLHQSPHDQPPGSRRTRARGAARQADAP